MEFTTSQKQAIESQNAQILVSAGAGSGKTAVLSSRVAKLVEQGVPVQEIVVVTFTRAAATEMKIRIRKLLEASESAFAREQAEKIEVAPISTLHSFASAVLKQYFFEIGIDPAFQVLDDKMSIMLKNRSLDAVMRDLTNERNEDFFDLVDVFFQNRKDENLRKLIFSVSDFLASLEDPESFKQKAKEVYFNCGEKSEISEFLISEISSRANHFKNRLDNLVLLCKEKGASKLLDVLYELELHLSRLKPNNSLAQMKIAASGFSAPTRIMRAGAEDVAEEVSSFKSQVKKFFDGLGDILCVGKTEEEQQSENFEAKNRICALFDLIEKFEKEYQDSKIELGGLDFADLERKFLQLLQNPKAKSQITSKIKALFVDEFQDTNRLQSAIYQNLASNGVFYVGDVKQSIYAFRLAEPKIFQETREEFRNNGGEVIRLEDNFRSHQELIAFTNLLFSKIMTKEVGGEDYRVEGSMKKGGDDFPKPASGSLFSVFSSGGFPRVKICAIKKAKIASKTTEELEIYSVKNHQNSKDEKMSSAIAEGRVLAKTLKELTEAKIYDPRLQKERPIESKDIAVLSASRGEYLKTLLQTAEVEGYSFAPDIATDIFDDADMAEFLNLLKLVQNPKQDVVLFIALAGFFGKLSSEELAKIKLWSNKNHTNFFEVIEEFKDAQVDSEMQCAQQKVRALYGLVDELQFLSSYSLVTKLFTEIDKRTDFVRHISEKSEQKTVLYESLVDRVENSAINRDLDEFLWTAENIGFSATETVSASSGIAMFDQKGEAVRTFQNVLVTTIHKSKGLEFPIVILVGAGRPFNRDDLSKDFILSRKLGMGISSFDTLERTKSGNIVKNAIKLDLQRQSLEEDIRLFYVAITRAINNLVIIGVGDPTENESVTKNIISSANFFDLLSKVFETKLPASYIKVEKDSFEMLAQGNMLEVPSEVVSFPHRDDLVEKFEKAFEFEYGHKLATKLSQKYSVTELAEKQHVVEVASLGFESSTNIGNAYHHVMEHINFSTKNHEELQLEKFRLLQHGLVSKEELELVEDSKILECLNSPLFVVLASGKRKILREQEFLMTVPANEVGVADVLDHVLVQGVFDLVVFDKDSVLVVDYKTGGGNTHEEIIEKHKRQMELYAMAAEKAFGVPAKVAIWSFALSELVRVV